MNGGEHTLTQASVFLVGAHAVSSDFWAWAFLVLSLGFIVLCYLQLWNEYRGSE